MDYLITSKTTLALTPVKKYTNTWQATLVDNKGKLAKEPEDFYFNTGALTPLKTPPPSAPDDAGTCYGFGAKDDLALFESFWVKWLANTAAVYRGVPGCHFSWANLVKGNLVSEGKEDNPTFTMGNSKPTLWLPTAVEEDLAQAVGLQCIDEHTVKLSETNYLPVGICLQIPLGTDKGVAACWLNSGEMVVKGPLGAKQWSIKTMCILFKKDPPKFVSWPKDVKLFPARPYKPKKKDEIEAWLKNMAPWTQTKSI